MSRDLSCELTAAVDDGLGIDVQDHSIRGNTLPQVYPEVVGEIRVFGAPEVAIAGALVRGEVLRDRTRRHDFLVLFEDRITPVAGVGRTHLVKVVPIGPPIAGPILTAVRFTRLDAIHFLGILHSAVVVV